MAGRVARRIVVGLGVGLLPLLLAYLVRSYYLTRAPGLRDVLGSGDGLLIAVSWLAVALLDLIEAPPRGGAAGVLAGLATFCLIGGSVAYGCLSADSVTGRVQTRGQAEIVTVFSLGLLAAAATISATAVSVASRPRKEQRT